MDLTWAELTVHICKIGAGNFFESVLNPNFTEYHTWWNTMLHHSTVYAIIFAYSYFRGFGQVR